MVNRESGKGSNYGDWQNKSMVKRTLFFANKAYLSFSNKQLLISTGDNKVVRAIEDIAVVVLEHPEITVTQHAIQGLMENNVAVIFCGSDHMPKGLLMPLEGHQLQSERFRHQVTAGEALKKNLWMQTVKTKVENQHKMLETAGSSVNLLTLAAKVRSGDPDNIEGMAARRYWEALFGAEFRRERFGDTPNPFLNYGYAVLRASVTRALVGSGLLPTLGIFHRNRYNAFCLADDIMEPYRPWVDREVFIMQQEGLTEGQLEKESKLRLVNILQADVQIGKKSRPMSIALSETTASLAACFTGEKRKISYGTFVS